MNMKRLIAASVASLLLSGCETLPPFEDYSGEDAACIEIGPADSSDPDGLNVVIESIDNVRVLWPRKRIRPREQRCVSPGEHRVRLWGWRHTNYWNGDKFDHKAYLDWPFERGRRYEIRAKAIGRNTVHFSLVDITSGRKAQLFEFEGDAWPDLLPLGPIYVAFSKGPGALAVWEKTQELARDFAFESGLPREDRVCPYGFHGITRGDQCISYVSSGTSLVISYSAKRNNSLLVFTTPGPFPITTRSALEVQERFDKAVVSPLRNEFGSDLHCEIGCP